MVSTNEKVVGKPYSVAALADRWGCSETCIRDMIHRRELSCFRAGRLIRIPAWEVERVECGSNGIEGPGTQSGQGQEEQSGSRYERKIVALPNNALKTYSASPSANRPPKFIKPISQN